MLSIRALILLASVSCFAQTSQPVDHAGPPELSGGTVVAHNSWMNKDTTLSPATVPVNMRKLFGCTVDNPVYAQPLYLVGVTVSGTVQNVLYVATMNDTVYLFNIDGASCVQLWTRHLGSPYPTGNGAIAPGTMGCLGTGTYYASTNMLHQECEDVSGNWIHYRLNASTGAINAQMTISFTSTGIGDQNTAIYSQSVCVSGEFVNTDSNSGTYAFQPTQQIQRGSLIVDSGHVLVPFTTNNDNHAAHGYLVALNESDLSTAWTFNTSPNGYFGGIWNPNRGVGIDGSHHIYFVTGNGDNHGYSGNSGDYGNSAVTLSSSGSALGDWISPTFPYTPCSIEVNDEDAGSGGFTLIPGSAGSLYLAWHGKPRALFVIPVTCLAAGTCGSSVQQVAIFQSSGDTDPDGGRSISFHQTSTTAGLISVASLVGAVENYPWNISTNTLTTTPSAILHASTSGWQIPGLAMSVGSNGNAGAIIWGITAIDSNYPFGDAALCALDGTSLVILKCWNDGMLAKFVSPTVIGWNGRVVMPLWADAGGSTHSVGVYGIGPPVSANSTSSGGSQ